MGKKQPTTYSIVSEPTLNLIITSTEHLHSAFNSFFLNYFQSTVCYAAPRHCVFL